MITISRNGLTNKIGGRIDTIKKSLDGIMNPVTHKSDDTDYKNYLIPQISPKLSKKVYENYPTLNAVVRVLSADCVLNEYNFTTPSKVINDELTSNNLEEIDQFWSKNKYELYKAVTQYFAYGYGACEILMDEATNTRPAGLKQISSELIKIEKRRFKETGDEPFYYGYYNNRTGNNIRLRLIREDYSTLDQLGIDDGFSGYCMWIGGDTDSDYFSKPAWTSCYRDILTAIEKKELDYNTIRNGNIPQGLLLIKGGVESHIEGEEDVKDVIDRQISEAGGGVAMAYVSGVLTTNEVDAQYTKIQDDNYSYLADLISATDDIILMVYKVPKVRLMIDDTKESLNSQKSETIYEIYSNNLSAEQVPIESEIDIFNEICYNQMTTCDINTPIFADTKSVDTTTIVSMFEAGIIPLNIASDMIMRLYPNIDWSTVDLTDPLMFQRFYKGTDFMTQGIQTGMEDFTMANLRGEYVDPDTSQEPYIETSQSIEPDGTGTSLFK